MRFMIIVKATRASEAGRPPSPELLSAMAAFHGELVRAGVLLDAAGLQPSAKGWRVHCGADGRRVTEGPFADTHALIAGYTLIEVRSREEATEWVRRFPVPCGEGEDGEIEVRQLCEVPDVGPGETVDAGHHRPAAKP